MNKWIQEGCWLRLSGITVPLNRKEDSPPFQMWLFQIFTFCYFCSCTATTITIGLPETLLLWKEFPFLDLNSELEVFFQSSVCALALTRGFLTVKFIYKVKFLVKVPKRFGGKDKFLAISMMPWILVFFPDYPTVYFSETSNKLLRVFYPYFKVCFSERAHVYIVSTLSSLNQTL